MPAQPSWYPKIPAIRSILLKSDAPSLDRATIQSLFGVGDRQANNIVRTLGGYRVGTSHVVNRTDLLDKLDELSKVSGVVKAATQRKESVLETFETLRQADPPIRVPKPKPPKNSFTLPDGISIPGAGKLLIEHSGPHDVLTLIMALAKMANEDFAGYTDAIEGTRMEVGSLQTAQNGELSDGN